MKVSWEGSGYALCEARTGRNNIWPDDANRACPECDRDFVLDDYVVVAEDESGEQAVYHRSCVEGQTDGQSS